MSLNDTILCHCVELRCPDCGHEIRIARCSVDCDAEALVHIYRRDILLGNVRCSGCGHPIELPSAICRVNRSADDAEARDMARLDAMIADTARDFETGYDGVRADHTDLECRGGEA